MSIVHTLEFNSLFRHGKAFTQEGGPIHYVYGGSGPALLLIHGWMGTWYSWRKIMPLLAASYTVIVPDCRGYGDSHKPYAGYDGRTVKDELRAVVKSLGVEKLYVAGHDMGALVALLHAAEHRDEVLGLGFFDEPLVGYNLDQFTAFTLENPFVYWWFAFNSQPHVPALLWEGKEAQMVDYFLTAMVTDARAITPEDKAEYVRGLRSPGGLHGSFGWYRESLVTGQQIREATGTKLTCPVLALNGQFGHPGVLEQMSLVAENVQGQTIPFCGHMLAEEFPAEVAGAIRMAFRVSAVPAGQAPADLAGRHIVVGGATGDVGVDIARQLLASGASVSALVRSGPRVEALDKHDRLRIIAGFPETEAGVQAATDALGAYGPIDGAVASLGPWFHGPALCDLPLSDWTRMLQSSLTSHYLFARSIFPLLGSGGQYVMINGGAALTPVPHSGVVSILARAQLMIGEVLAAENPAVGVHTVMLQSVIATRARAAPDPAWVTSTEVGEACAWLFTDPGRLTAGSTLTLTARMRIPQT